MNTIRYQTSALSQSPLSRLSAFQHEVDRMFDLPFFGSISHPAAALAPTVDLYGSDDALVVTAELPGMKREDFRLTLQDGTLSISGERVQEKAHDEKSALRNERFFGKFERTVTLPHAVDVSRVSATYEDGILRIELPKAEEAKPRQIEIK